MLVLRHSGNLLTGVYQQAPFDHPELTIANGAAAGGAENFVTLPAIGSAGSASPLGRFLGLNPFN